jgi:hypothetical protein
LDDEENGGRVSVYSQAGWMVPKQTEILEILQEDQKVLKEIAKQS